MSVAGLTKLVRAPHFAERQDTVNDRCELGRVDDLRDLCELRAVRLRAMIAARTPSSLAFSSDGGWTNETRFPPFFKTDQDRSCVSPPSVSRTMSMLRASLRIVVVCNRSARPRRACAASPDSW